MVEVHHDLEKKVYLDNLEALGAKRPAELLMEFSENDAATKSHLRLELAAREAPETVAIKSRKSTRAGH